MEWPPFGRPLTILVGPEGLEPHHARVKSPELYSLAEYVYLPYGRVL